MSTAALAEARGRGGSMVLVVAAAAAGTAFEWYDFFIYAPLAAIMSRVFFAGLNDSTAYILALLTFAVGFGFRPIGALLFGRLGDRIGRKATFLITMSLMGLSTAAIGLLPGYATTHAAPLMLVGLRIIQGLALGGEWGGAAIYIVEHVETSKRGSTSSWLGGSAAFGLAGATAVVLIVRSLMGEETFNAWGWRLPFLFSLILLGISIWIRLQLQESPVFARMKAEGARSDRPYAESFLPGPNLKRVLLALFGIMIAQGAVWYAVFFYAITFLEQTIKVDPRTLNAIVLALSMASVPAYWFAGWLSDRIGRKPVMLFGIVLTLVAYFPAFHLLERAGNPALAAAQKSAPVTVIADPADCSFQFDPVGKTQFRSSCDIAKSTLAKAGVNYTNQAAAAGAIAQVRIGEAIVRSVDASKMTGAELAGAKKDAAAAITKSLRAAGYPEKADPASTNRWTVFLTLVVLMIGATALYGPQAAALVELFPARVRYTALSLPYHIGTGWVGGFLPATAFAIVTATGNIFAGLWYPVVFTAISAVVMALFFKETRGRNLEAEPDVRPVGPVGPG
jgi:MFS family permease